MIKKILYDLIPQKKVVAFGSRVKDTEKSTSDLDLCVIGTDALSFEKLAALRDEFSDSDIPYKVDVVDWSTLDADFQAIIKELHEIIQEAK